MAKGAIYVGNTRYKTIIFMHVPIDSKFDLNKHLQKFMRVEEIFDAFVLFDYLATRERLRNSESRFFGRFNDYAQGYLGELNLIGILEKCKLDLGLNDAFKMRSYGKSLALPEFKS